MFPCHEPIDVITLFVCFRPYIRRYGRSGVEPDGIGPALDRHLVLWTMQVVFGINFVTNESSGAKNESSAGDRRNNEQ